MKKLSMTLLLALASIGLPALNTSVHAQNDGDQQGQRSGQDRGRGPRGGRPGGGETGLIGLLRIEEVQEELQLTEEQLTAIQAFGEESSANRPEFPRNFRDLTEEEQATLRKSMDDWQVKQNAEAKSVLGTLLEPEQFTRLTEIFIQQRGVTALRDPEVATKLEISDEQQTRIAEAITASQESLRTEMRAAFSGGQGGGDREAMMKKFAEMRAASEKQVLAELTADQIAAFEALKGEAFDMPQRGFGGGGRRGRGGDQQ